MTNFFFLLILLVISACSVPASKDLTVTNKRSIWVDGCGVGAISILMVQGYEEHEIQAQGNSILNGCINAAIDRVQ